MDATTILGSAAGTLTTLALLPQAVRIWRTRSAEDVSAATYATTSAGIALWVAYGVRIRSMPVIVFNLVTLALALLILALKAHFRRR
jgi:MtN3 and saliva related transmembrane protein